MSGRDNTVVETPTMSRQDRTDTLLWVIVAVLAVVVLLPVLLMLLVMPMGMMGMWGGGGTGMSPIWGVGTTLVVLAVLLGVGYVVYSNLDAGRLGERDGAIEELRSAYARGELTDDEFERRRERLRRDRE